MPFTATPLPTGGVQLVLSGVPFFQRLVSLSRTDANGLRPVRLHEGQGLSGGHLAVVDHEAALTGTILYRAVTAGAHPVTGPTRQNWHQTTTLDGLLTRDRIASVARPATGISPLAVLDTYSAEHADQTVIHEVIGRADPLASLGVQALRRGTLTVLCDDYQSARSLVSAVGSEGVLLWRQRAHPGLDMYFTARTQATPAPARTTPRRWLATMTFTELAVPSGPILGAYGWSVADLAGSGLTVETVPDAYATVTALTIGPLP